MGNSSCQSCSVADCDKGSRPCSAPVIPSKPAVSQASSPSLTWDFNPLGLDSATLQHFADKLLSPSFTGSGGRKEEVLQNFVMSVSTAYRQVAFHNFMHAVDTLQAMRWQCSQAPWDTNLQHFQRFALVMAAFVVDIGHPGFDNAFLVDSGDPIASCYNDLSPLENMHSSKLFEILKKDGHNVLGHIPSEEFREMRKLMIDLLLHTDKYCYRDVVDDVRILARQGYAPKSADHSSEEGAAILQVVMRAMMLTADLSNQARSLDAANDWASMLQQELGLQDEQERELGLQVLPLNRWKPALGDLQLHLGMTRSGPLLGAWLRVFPALAPATMQLSQNSKSWAEACMTQNEVEGTPGADERAKKLEAMLDPARPIPALGEAGKGHDRFGYLAAARPYIGRQQIPPSTLSTMSLGSGSPTMSQPTETATSSTNQQPPPLVREVRRWKEGKGIAANKEFSSSSKGRELVLLYVLADPNSSGKPLPFQFVDRNSASLSESAAADVAVAKGMRAASDDVQYDRKRRMSCFDGSPGGQVFQTQRSADAVSTVVEPGRFDDVLSSLLHGNIVIPHSDHGTSSSPMMPLHPGRASRTSQVVSEISAATRDRAMMAASVFGVLLRGDHSNV
ncbi:PDE9A [Symbiodinium natans]|uniref:PDE9A protein n=1 Tax=Symbiodinium natans TaxID=878477 RepID=A0A812R1T8_9DINO|nr:PDE9A [Symbiodinium natans]